MTTSDFSSSMARICGVESTPVVRAGRIQNAGILITRLDITAPPVEQVRAFDVDDAFVASVTVQDGYRREGWVDNKNIPVQHPHPAGALAILDLRMKNEIRWITPVNSVQFFFPKRALDTIAEANELASIDEIRSPVGWINHDPTFAALAQSMLLPFEMGISAMPLFVEHVVAASAIHLLTRHGAATSRTSTFKGGLSLWQQKRVNEILDQHGCDPSLEQLALETKLSMRHFARAFAQTYGMPPYRWLLRRRIAFAKNLLRESRLGVDDIAVSVGFADQCHFSRVFKQVVGTTPAAWRRSMSSDPSLSDDSEVSQGSNSKYN